MAQGQNFKLQSLGVKSETTQGGGATLTASDYLWVSDINIKPVIEKLERDYARNTGDSLPHAIGKAHYEISFKTELKGSGVTGSKYNPLDALLQASGMTVSASANDITYTPTSQPSSSAFSGFGKSAYIEFVRDKYKRTISGLVGTYKIAVEAGKIPMLEFSGKGLFSAATDAAATPGFTGSNQTIPATAVATTVTIDGTSPSLSKLEFDIANNVQERPDMTAQNGIAGFMITGRKAKGSIDPECTTVAGYDFLNKAYNGTQFAMSATIGSTAGNRVVISAPCVQMDDVTDQARNEVAVFQIPVSFNGTGSFDNCLSIKFN